MKARIVISPTGKIGIFTDEGTLEEGAAKIKDLLNLLRANGIELDGGDRIEQHRHAIGVTEIYGTLRPTGE